MTVIQDAAERVEQFRLHPLGFFFLQNDVGKGRTLRIHVWLPDGPAKPENDCHQHSFDIESSLIAGRMRSDLYRFEENQKGAVAEFAVSYDGHNSTLERSGRRGVLVPMASFETVAGAGYRLEAGIIHRVSVTEVPCISVVRTFERGVPIFSYGQGDEAASDRRHCNEAEAGALRQHLLADSS